MTNKSRSSEQDGSVPVEVDPARFPTARPGVLTGPFSKVPSDPGMLGGRGWSFDGVLQRVLGFSHAAELEGDARRPGAPRERHSSTIHVGAPSPAFDALRLFVRSLDLETQEKLRALMRAGREALPLPAAVAALSAEEASGDPSASELFVRGTVELQDLQRGHAVACATAFDLERDFAAWGSSGEPHSLEERVWLRFGCELAQSRIEEWACFAVVDARDRLQKLYLRRGKSRWWSFAALIDRPSDRALGVARSANSGRPGVLVLPLQAALGRSFRVNLRAVRRASLAMSARFGQRHPPARRATFAAAAKVTVLE